MAQERPRGANPRPRSGVAARRSYPCPRPGEAARRIYPTPEVTGGSQEEQPHVQEWWLCGCRRAERSYSTFKVRRGSGEEIPLVQGKEQRLRFAGAAMKRYPTSKVRETQVRP